MWRLLGVLAVLSVASSQSSCQNCLLEQSLNMTGGTTRRLIITYPDIVKVVDVVKPWMATSIVMRTATSVRYCTKIMRDAVPCPTTPSLSPSFPDLLPNIEATAVPELGDQTNIFDSIEGSYDLVQSSFGNIKSADVRATSTITQRLTLKQCTSIATSIVSTRIVTATMVCNPGLLPVYSVCSEEATCLATTATVYSTGTVTSQVNNADNSEVLSRLNSLEANLLTKLEGVLAEIKVSASLVIESHQNDTEKLVETLTSFKACDVGALKCFGPELDYKCYCYFFGDGYYSWNVAQDKCKQRGGNLVSIRNQREQDFANEFYNMNPAWQYNAWIGMGGDKTSWSDGKSVDYMNWEGGLPDGFGECGAIAIGSGKWNDWNCGIAIPSLCRKDAKQPVQPVPAG